jgi:hypothetical protein
VNSQRGDPFTLLDARVTKFFTIGRENRKLGVFAEFFNLFCGWRSPPPATVHHRSRSPIHNIGVHPVTGSKLILTFREVSSWRPAIHE